jgi:predicted alpha/beta-hydrolase family hydrolase
LRTNFFPDLQIPALFVHGSDDPFGSLEELSAALKLIPAPRELLKIDRSGHDLKRAGELAELIIEKLRTLADPVA